jgi:hypothetical protein
MATPCPRCGATKTESARHGIVYRTLWRMGYHLRRCSFCNRPRLFKRADPGRPHPDDMTHEQLRDYYDKKVAEAGGTTRWTAQSSSPREAPVDSSIKAVPVVAKASTSVGVAQAAEEVEEEYPCCPKCGSESFRRSRRKFYERWLHRPRMARCRTCGHRFPYPH